MIEDCAIDAMHVIEVELDLLWRILRASGIVYFTVYQ